MARHVVVADGAGGHGVRDPGVGQRRGACGSPVMRGNGRAGAAEGARPGPKLHSSSSLAPSVSLLVAKSSKSSTSPVAASSESSMSSMRPLLRSRIGPFGAARSGLALPFGAGPRRPGPASSKSRGGRGARGGPPAGAPPPPPPKPPPAPPPPPKPPPPPPPNPPPPPGPPGGRGENGRCSRSRASLIASGRPLRACPLNWRITSSATARSANSTNAKPRGRPVSRSTGSATCAG